MFVLPGTSSTARRHIGSEFQLPEQDHTRLQHSLFFLRRLTGLVNGMKVFEGNSLPPSVIRENSRIQFAVGISVRLVKPTINSIPVTELRYELY
jgi:hypothetical protein